LYKELGKLFCFGDNEHGELGIGEDRNFYDVPQELNFFENLELKEINCGNGFSFAICGKFQSA
jgi:alpha-tubulin suppressor-like RCC1 family protein